MPQNQNLPQRRSLRLQEYDYTQPGSYFVTLVTWQRKMLFGEIIREEMQLNPNGQIALVKLMSLLRHFPITIDSWIIMPNHIHAVISLQDQSAGEATAGRSSINRLPFAVASPLQNGTRIGSLGSIIQNYKSVTSKKINRLSKTIGAPVWQRNYYEHIVRNKDEMQRIDAYILDNPRCWSEDPENQ